MPSLHQRAITYTTNPSSHQLDALIPQLSYAFLHHSTQSDALAACETLATSLHIPTFERVQVLLWSANYQPPSAEYLRVARVMCEFARFWMELLKEETSHRHHIGKEEREQIEWLEWGLQMFREKLNERTVEVMVEEWKQKRFEGHHVGKLQEQNLAPGVEEDDDDDFAARMFEHPIFSLEWVMWQDRQQHEARENASEDGSA